MNNVQLKSSDLAIDCWQQWADDSTIDISEDLQTNALRVFTLSEFVAKQTQRKPELFHSLIQSKRLQQPSSFEAMQKCLLDNLQIGINEYQLGTHLRAFRNQQMFAIYWRDLLDLADVKETCEQVSFLADICIQQTVIWHHKNLCQEMKLIDELSQPQPLIVIGMGKLGGNELNVSSDIDLIFCYQEKPEHVSNKIDYPKFFNILGQRVIKSLDQVTADGFVFRVDMRLRPYGDSGPLVMSLSAIEEYYQDQGRDWERFALIKARIITGLDDDVKHLRSLLKPFVFRRYIDYSVLESPRQMKNLINQELRRRNLIDNIKLGPGGIREVEFIAQALQLIHGGREPLLQCRTLFQSLPRLQELKFLSKDIVEELLTNYLFLRKVEHRLQAKKDQQTQELPSDHTEQLQLAQGLNFNDWQSFRDYVSNAMAIIHRHFNELFQDPELQHNIADIDDVFQIIWQGDWQDNWQDNCSMDPHLGSLIEQAGLEDAKDITNQISKFRDSSAVRHMGPRGAKRLDQLMPVILQIISTMDHQSRNLKPVLTLMSAITTRTAYLELLAENKPALKQMIKLCSKSVRIAQQIADFPYVLDELINPNTLFHPPEISQLPDMLRQSLCRIPEDDPELQMDSLREFRQLNLLRVTAADIAGGLSVREVSRYLTAIAETVIDTVVKLAWQQLCERHGTPESQDSKSIDRAHGFAIIAYGKLGGQELGYGSDLDLVFLHNAIDGKTNGDKPIENAVFYMRLAQKVIHFLSIRTRSGVLYEVDMRLRPSGNSGLLVSHIDAFIEYQNESAWTWEHQALIRARCILGSISLREQFEKTRNNILCNNRDVTNLSAQVKKMREKMRSNLLEENLDKKNLFDLKQSYGGIADIEFLTQYLVLKLASDKPNLVISSNTSELLSALSHLALGKGLSSTKRLQDLVPVYEDLRVRINQNSLQNKTNIVDVDSIKTINTSLVVKLWNDLLG